jgi:hypothetical protein
MAGALPAIGIVNRIVNKCQSTIHPNNLLLDRSPNIGPLIARWELDKFKNC